MTLNATSKQLMFGHDMLFDLFFKVDWMELQNKCRHAREKENTCENNDDCQRRGEKQYSIFILFALYPYLSHKSPVFKKAQGFLPAP